MTAVPCRLGRGQLATSLRASHRYRHEPFARKLATWPSTITIDLELGWGFYDRWIERATARLELLGSVGHGWVMGGQFVV